ADPQEIKKALDLVDYRKIRLDPKGRTVQLLLMGMLLDVGGIAKGYTADAVLEVLRQHGITRALVAAGGDLAAGDPPPDAAGLEDVAGLLVFETATGEEATMSKRFAQYVIRE